MEFLIFVALLLLLSFSVGLARIIIKKVYKGRKGKLEEKEVAIDVYRPEALRRNLYNLLSIVDDTANKVEDILRRPEIEADAFSKLKRSYERMVGKLLKYLESYREAAERAYSYTQKGEYLQMKEEIERAMIRLETLKEKLRVLYKPGFKEKVKRLFRK